MLVDAMKLRSRTASIASLCIHKAMEIRLFNPWTQQGNAIVLVDSAERVLSLHGGLGWRSVRCS